MMMMAATKLLTFLTMIDVRGGGRKRYCRLFIGPKKTLQMHARTATRRLL
jgi:hypothetical protein